MAIKFQYNKTSLQQLEKQLKVRVRTLPIIKNKESALRMEVKRCKADAAALDARLEKEIQAYEAMLPLMLLRRNMTAVHHHLKTWHLLLPSAEEQTRYRGEK